MNAECAGMKENGEPPRPSDTGPKMAGDEADAGEQPLLLDTVPGEDEGRRSFSFAAIGQGLMVGIIAALLSVPSLNGGWEGVWYIPRGELFFVLPLSLFLMVAGGILYLLGRRDETA
jgi:hypothetical protein